MKLENLAGGSRRIEVLCGCLGFGEPLKAST